MVAVTEQLQDSAFRVPPIESRPRLRRYVHPELIFSPIRLCFAPDIKPFVWRMHIQGSSAALPLFLWDECG